MSESRPFCTLGHGCTAVGTRIQTSYGREVIRWTFCPGCISVRMPTEPKSTDNTEKKP